MPLPEGLFTKIETDYSCKIQKIENLKSGSNGTVYHLTTIDGRELCIKEVAVENKSGEMDYKYAVKMFGGTDYSVSKYDDVSSSHYYVILPFFPGKPLTHFLPNKKFVNLTTPDIATLQQRKIIFAKILIKMEEMHARGIIHRDLKSDNIIVKISPDGEVEVHIIDFGRSVDPFDHVTGKATATLEDLSLRSTTTAWYQFYYLTQIVRWLTQPQTAKELTSLWSADSGDVSFRTDYASLPHLYRDLLPDCPDMASDLATKHGTDRTRAYCKFLWKYLKQVNLGHECERFTSIDAIITAIKREKALAREAAKTAVQQEKQSVDAIQSSYSSTSSALYTSESKTSVSSGSDTDATLDAAVDKVLDDTNELGLDNNVAGAVDVILQIQTQIISEEDRIHIIKEDRAVSPSFF